MRLTRFTDFGLRALMRLAAEPGRAHSTAEIAEEFGISRTHLTKAMATLAAAGFIETQRGAGGGARLTRPAQSLRLGEVVATLEQGTALVDCFGADGSVCSISPTCRLRGLLADAERHFIDALNRHTLADFALPPKREPSEVGHVDQR